MKLGAVGAAFAISAFVSGTAFATTPTMYSWAQGEASATLVSWHSDLCVLSAIEGNFEGIQEAVTLSTGSDGNWHLSGASATSGIWAQVSCVPWSAFTGSFTGVKLSGNWTLDWNGGSSNGTTEISLWGNDSYCGVRSVSGNLSGDLQDVALFQISGDPWTFQVDAYSSQVNGGAGCAGFDWSTNVTANVSPMVYVDLNNPSAELPPTNEALCGLTSVAGIYHTDVSAAYIGINANSQGLGITNVDQEGDGEVATAQCLYYAQP